MEIYDVIGTNVALRKKATSSSQYHEDGDPSRAIDGNRETLFHSKSCLEGGGGDCPNPWLQIDLGRLFNIHRIVIYNRNELRDRLNNAQLLLYDADGRLVMDWISLGDVSQTSRWEYDLCKKCS